MAEASAEGLPAIGNLTLKSSDSASDDPVLGSTAGLTFVQSAIDLVTEAFGSDQWRDATKNVPYTWKSPVLEEKEGDQAEEDVFTFLSQQRLCDMLGESVYLISGKANVQSFTTSLLLIRRPEAEIHLSF